MPRKKKLFADYFYNWYETYRRDGLKKVTQNKYEIVHRQISRSNLGSTPVDKITRKVAQEYIDEYGKTHRKATAYDNRAFLKACMADAVIDGDATANPFARVEIKYTDQHFSTKKKIALRNEKKTLSMTEYKQFKQFLECILVSLFKRKPKENWSESDTDGGAKGISKQNILVAIYVALKTGARFAEILGLTWKDIDFDKNVIDINKTWNYRFDSGFDSTKNLGSIRKVLVDKDLLDMLQLYKNWQEEYKIETKENTLFIEKGKKYHNSTINIALRRCLKSCHIEPITLHKLRHTHASILLAEGIDMNVVAKRLGHADTTMIQRIYGHLIEEREEEDNKRILQLL